MRTESVAVELFKVKVVWVQVCFSFTEGATATAPHTADSLLVEIEESRMRPLVFPVHARTLLAGWPGRCDETTKLP